MAWGRVLNVYAGKTLDGVCADVSQGITGNGNFIQLVGADPLTGGAGLDCEANIRRSNRMSKNTATVKIFNLNEQLRNFLRNDGLLLRVDVGYEDSGAGTIFYGAFGGAQSYLNGADWTTEINAFHFRAKGMSYEALYVSFEYAPGTLFKQLLQDFQNILGVPVYGIAGVGAEAFPNGFAYVGTMGGAIKHFTYMLRSKGFGLFFDLAEMVVYRVASLPDAKARFETVYLDKDHGLLNARWKFTGVKESRQEVRTMRKLDRLNKAVAKTRSADGRTRTDQTGAKVLAQLRLDEEKRHRIQFECLANHRLRPSCPVQIDHQDVVGTFIVDDIEARLTNFADPFDFKVWASVEG
jgi:hypothetical protein